jgi:hypothetical protein
MNITSNLLAANCPYTFIDVVPVDVIPSLETLLQTRHFLDRLNFVGLLYKKKHMLCTFRAPI